MEQQLKPEHHLDEAKLTEAFEALKAQVEEHEQHYQDGPEKIFCVTTRSSVVAMLMSYFELELVDLGIIAEQFLYVETPAEDEKNVVENPDMRHSDEEWETEIPG